MARPQRQVLAALLVVLAVGVVPPVAVGQTTPAQPDADNTVTRIEVFENGTARWSIQVRTRLETPTEVDRYRAFQDQLRANRSRAIDRFRTRMAGVVAAAANATGREMTARGFGLSTHIQEVPQRWGVVTYEFTWIGFAARDGEAVVVGDVFEGGFFLAEDDRLVVVAPTGFHTASTDPAPGATLDDAVAWDGRRDFEDGRPRVRLEPEPTPAGPAETEVPPSTARPVTHETTPGGRGLSAVPPWLLALGGLLALGAVALAARRWRRGGPGRAGTREPTTDADRIRTLLADHGGQLKQTEIDDAVDWSASKTSRVLSRMAEDGAVEKLRIGRENVIRLPEDDDG